MRYYLFSRWRRLKAWLSFHRQILRTPRKDRPVFWLLQTTLTVAKAQVVYDIHKTMFGDGPGVSIFDGLGDIINER